MSEMSDQLLRGYQAQEKCFVERRFPLHFEPENPAIRELYSQSKGFRWNPVEDIAWARPDPTAFVAPVREAARPVSIPPARGLYPAPAASPPPLLPFCLQSGAAGQLGMLR